MNIFARLYTRWRSYSLEDFRADLLSSIVVALVAVPLALGFAIASGVDPAMGIIAAVVGGFVAGFVGGSEFNISGPTGAMVVVVLGVVASYGLSGLILATVLAGFILILIGLLRLGKIIEYIPSPVIVGFTAGIAVIIGLGQLNNLFAISPAYPAGAGFVTKTVISLQHVGDAKLAAIGLAVLTVLIMVACRSYLKRVPGHIIAIVVTTGLVFLIPTLFSVPQVHDIGIIPQTLPMPHIPAWSWELVRHLLPAVLTIAALAAIESLLSAVVADGMTDTRHNPNRELVGSGAANIASGLFGGLPITGAIARTATNIRAGGRSRLTAIMHSVFVFAFVFFAAPLLGRIPLAAIAGILMFTAFYMVEWERVHRLFRTPLSDVAVMLTTFTLTIVVDLTAAIEVGLILASLLFMKRMTDLYSVESLEGSSDGNALLRGFRHKHISIYTIRGPLFFGAANRIDQTLGETPGGHKRIKILRLQHVPVIDATGLTFLEGTAHRHRRMGGMVLFVGVQSSVRERIREAGLHESISPEHFFATTHEALAYALRAAAAIDKRSPASAAAELAHFDFTSLDREEGVVIAHTEDTDPVEELFDSVGISKVVEFGQDTVESTRKLSKRLTQRSKAPRRKSRNR